MFTPQIEVEILSNTIQRKKPIGSNPFSNGSNPFSNGSKGINGSARLCQVGNVTLDIE
jgi:hypothetical protein